MKAKSDMETADPTKTVFGLSLPADWKHELTPYVRSGELARLLKVKAITFEGKKITGVEPPERKGDHG